MASAHAVAAAIAAAGLLAGWLFLRVLTGGTGTGTDPYLETVGVALSTPAGLVALTYLSGVFRVRAYYGERPTPRLAGDVLLSVLGALTAGLVATAVAMAVVSSPLTLFVVGATVTFLAGVATFFVRTRPFLAWDPASE